MNYRVLGRTKLSVSCVGLGGIGLISENCSEYSQALDVIKEALDRGVNFIDTARTYKDSEKKIGYALEKLQKDCIIASKTMCRDYKGARQDIELSLRDLRKECVDIYMIHNIQFEEELKELMSEDGAVRALKEAKQNNKIRFIGVSLHRPEVAALCIRSGVFDVIEIPFNPVDGIFYKQILQDILDNDIGVIAMKPLMGGIIKDAKLALRYILSFNFSTVVPGMSCPEHVVTDTEVGSRHKALSEAEKKTLFEEAENLGKDFCRRCGYCLSKCPQAIQIPDIFRFHQYITKYYTGDWAREQYALLDKKAADCLKCGQCEKICPYGLPVRTMLKEAHRELRIIKTFRSRLVKLLKICRLHKLAVRIKRAFLKGRE